MAFLFGRNRQRSASDLIRATKEQLQRLVNESENPSPKVQYDDRVLLRLVG